MDAPEFEHLFVLLNTEHLTEGRETCRYRSGPNPCRRGIVRKLMYESSLPLESSLDMNADYMEEFVIKPN
jgi:hypothetical protein